MECERPHVGQAPTFAQPVREDHLQGDGHEAQERGEDPRAALEPPGRAQRPAHLCQGPLLRGGDDGERGGARPAQGGDRGELASDGNVVARFGPRPVDTGQSRGHHSRQERPDARVGDRGSEDGGRQHENTDEQEAGAPAPARAEGFGSCPGEGNEDEARSPQGAAADGVAPHGERGGQKGEGQPGRGDPDDLPGEGSHHPCAGTQVTFRRTPGEDHGDDAEHRRGDETAGDRADRGENRPPVRVGRGGLKGDELVTPHPVARRARGEGDRDDRRGRASREPPRSETGQGRQEEPQRCEGVCDRGDEPSQWGFCRRGCM